MNDEKGKIQKDSRLYTSVKLLNALEINTTLEKKQPKVQLQLYTKLMVKYDKAGYDEAITSAIKVYHD